MFSAVKNKVNRTLGIERQELWCHDCGKYVQFDMDLSLNGNHVLNCPNCNHEHCRVVKNGIITGIRWDSRNRGPAIVINSNTINYTTLSTFTTTSSGTNSFLYTSWMDTSSNK